MKNHSDFLIALLRYCLIALLKRHLAFALKHFFGVSPAFCFLRED
jgi:hypothetical protein